MEYKLKITGEGTREQIAKALRVIADKLYHPTSGASYNNLPDEEVDGAEWEDYTLMTEINKL